MIRAKLDANESPIDIPLAIKEKILAAARDLPFNRYEGPHKEKLRALIAAENGLSPDGVLLGNGSDELIQLLVLTFSGPGKPVVIPTPHLPHVPICSQTGGEPDHKLSPIPAPLFPGRRKAPGCPGRGRPRSPPLSLPPQQPHGQQHPGRGSRIYPPAGPGPGGGR